MPKMENGQQIRSHMTKEQRLPKCFKEVEKILRSVKSCQINFKTVLAKSRLRGNFFKKVYSMTVNILKNYNYIGKIIDKIQLLEKEKYLRRELASILVYELIFGRGFLSGESKVIKVIQIYEDDIFKAHEVLQNRLEGSLTIDLNIPRYVRVHTLVTTVSYVIKDLTSYGFIQVLYDNALSEEKYLELVKNLKKGSFLIDFHFKDVLVFEHHENLVSLDLYKNGHIFLQDKSSYIPVHVLNPEPGSAVLDACAAPGMKTVHIAAKMKNKGLLIACERDKGRFECLKEMLNCGSVKICKSFCKDFKLIDPCDQAYSTIEYILLDPSCSGSGMVNRMDEVTDTENSKNVERLTKLAGFQIILLKHSLKFPSVKRVVYSTCSIHEEENEYVVHEALKAFSGTFKLIPAMPEWSHRGSEMFEYGKLCLRTDPKVHLINGFFVAVFERINNNGYAEECQNSYQNYPVEDSSYFNKKKRKLEKSHEKTASENYDNIKLKHKCSVAYRLETQMNESEHFQLINKNDESSGSPIQNVNYKREQNLVDAQQIKKKHKKKKTSKECFYESNELEIQYESVAKCSKEKEHSNISFPESSDNANIYMRKDKSIQNEHDIEESPSENIKVPEKFTDITKLQRKKKKKKKKDNFETAMQPIETCLPESNELNQEQPNAFSKQKHKITKLKQDKNILQSEQEHDSVVIHRSKDEYTQNKNLSNISYEGPEDHINMTSSHKKKKKEKYLNIDSIQSCKKSKENDISFSSIISGNINSRHQSVVNISKNNETPEGLVDVTLLHKKKKKKKKNKELSLEKEV